MRKASIVRLVAPKPRNIVIRALIALGKTTSTRHVGGQRRKVAHDRLDLAQRVREAGEW